MHPERRHLRTYSAHTPARPQRNTGGAVGGDEDLERRLDRFQEDARVLVNVAKQATGGRVA